MKTIISTTYNDNYLFFLPITTWSWNKLGVDVICFMPKEMTQNDSDKINLQENIFKKIYSKNYWGSDQTVSGPGSNLINTTNICIDLPKIISKYKIKKIIDAHSGVFNWMKLVVDKLVIEYLGCDIVKELIDVNKKLYCSKKVNFAELDLIKQQLPDSDLLIKV